jgi:hypothetical protein
MREIKLGNLNRTEKEKYFPNACLQSSTCHHRSREFTPFTIVRAPAARPKEAKQFLRCRISNFKTSTAGLFVCRRPLHAPSPSAWSRIYILSGSSSRFLIGSPSLPSLSHLGQHPPISCAFPDSKIFPSDCCQASSLPPPFKSFPSHALLSTHNTQHGGRRREWSRCDR